MTRFKRHDPNRGNKLYELAAEVINNTNNRTVGFKYAFNKTIIDKNLMRPVYGIGAKAISHWNTCDEVLEESGILEENPSIDKNLIRVIVVDLLWGSKYLVGDGEAIKAILNKRSHLRDLLSKHAENKDGEVYSSNCDQSMRVFYARVNSIKATVKTCLNCLTELGYSKINTPSSYNDFLDAIDSLDENEFMVDYHFNDLIVFHSKAKPSLLANSIFLDKSLIIQSKSSLIPVKLMNVKPGHTVLDMCAAPGMKTAIIASQLKGNGLVYAVDNDKYRFNAMIKNLEQLGALENTNCVNTDALLFKPENIDLILLDAPCSGSGMRSRLGETDRSAGRLRKLQWLQMKLLTFALTAHSSVDRVVYSTCSIYPEENEAVIDEVIKRNEGKLDYELVNCHELISGFSQGSTDYMCGKFCLKVSCEKDHTNGFFIAVFDKISTEIMKKSNDKTKAAKRKFSKIKQECFKGKIEVNDGDNKVLRIKLEDNCGIEDENIGCEQEINFNNDVRSKKVENFKRKGKSDDPNQSLYKSEWIESLNEEDAKKFPEKNILNESSNALSPKIKRKKQKSKERIDAGEVVVEEQSETTPLKKKNSTETNIFNESKKRKKLKKGKIKEGEDAEDIEEEEETEKKSAKTNILNESTKRKKHKKGKIKEDEDAEDIEEEVELSETTPLIEKAKTNILNESKKRKKRKKGKIKEEDDAEDIEEEEQSETTPFKKKKKSTETNILNETSEATMKCKKGECGDKEPEDIVEEEELSETYFLEKNIANESLNTINSKRKSKKKKKNKRKYSEGIAELEELSVTEL